MIIYVEILTKRYGPKFDMDHIGENYKAITLYQ